VVAEAAATQLGYARMILANLPDLADSLDAGWVATFEPSRIRIRMLPIT